LGDFSRNNARKYIYRDLGDFSRNNARKYIYRDLGDLVERHPNIRGRSPPVYVFWENSLGIMQENNILGYLGFGVWEIRFFDYREMSGISIYEYFRY